MSKKPVIDIGLDGSVGNRLFGYYATPLKTTPSGSLFKTYFGLRQYYITGGFDRRLLTLEDPKEILTLSRKCKWGHVWDLQLKLSSVLIYNLRKCPELVSELERDVEIDWRKPTGGLNQHERIWLDIVKNVNDMR